MTRYLLRIGRPVNVFATLGVLLVSAIAAGAETSDPQAVMRRLTPDQYRNVVSDIFGPGVKVGGGFEPEQRIEGLNALGDRRISITAAGLGAYYRSAQLVANQVFDPTDGLMVPCKPKDPHAPDSTCATKYFAALGELLYRRPLTSGELSTLVAAAGDGAETLHDFYGGLRSALAGALSSVPFLFRIEEPAPAGGVDRSRLSSYSLASRLSFFLWNSGPDEILLTAARNGDLEREKGVADQVDRMLKSQRLEAGVRAFFDDWLGFDSFATLEKDPDIYPKYTSAVANDAREQTLRTVTNKLLNEDGDYRELFTDGKTFLTPLLASVYRVPIAPSGIFGIPSGWTPYTFPPGDVRAGILGQVSFLALHSHPGRSSPTLRGKALREVFLCQKVPDPPANVDFTQFNDPNQSAKTARERLQAHAVNPACAGCHKITDPIGLSLESFDSVGAFRATENGAPLDTSGQLNGAKFTNAAELGSMISHDPAVPACLVNRLSAYATGDLAGPENRAWLKTLEKKFADDGYRVPQLIRAIATSPEFAESGLSEVQATKTVARAAVTVPSGAQSIREPK